MKELLLQEQMWWDNKQFDPELGYMQLSERDKKVNHILTHVGWAAAKFVRHYYPLNLTEVAPDLAIYRSQLINLFQIDPILITKSYSKKPTLDRVLDSIVLGNGELSKYVERRMHDEHEETDRIMLAARHLHIAARSIVEFYEPTADGSSSLAARQRTRMEELLGEALPEPFIEAPAATS